MELKKDTWFTSQARVRLVFWILMRLVNSSLRVRKVVNSVSIVTHLHNTLHWRHNGRDSVSNHQPHDCLLHRLFRRRSKKTSKLRVTGLSVGIHGGPVNSPHKWPVTRKMFPFDNVIMIYIINCIRPPRPRVVSWLQTKTCYMNNAAFIKTTKQNHKTKQNKQTQKNRCQKPHREAHHM